MLLSVFFIGEMYYFNKNEIVKDDLMMSGIIKRVKLNPFCDCSDSENEFILVEIYPLNDLKSSGKLYSVNLIKEMKESKSLKKELKKRHLYNISENELVKYTKTCDLYNVLRRGKHQKVIAYSLHGSNMKYSYNLEAIARTIRIKYRNFTNRIYYDKSVPNGIRCRFECQYRDFVDFCNIDQFTTDLNLDKENGNRSIDISYLDKSMWRYLAIGDSFVDVFMSRDIKSIFIDREIDSVNVWLKSNTIGHIMRGLFEVLTLLLIITNDYE